MKFVAGETGKGPGAIDVPACREGGEGAVVSKLGEGNGPTMSAFLGASGF